MPVLKNSRYEKVAQAIFSGATNENAYIEAGYSSKWARSNAAHALTTNHSIGDRIIELHEKAANVLIMPVRERKERLSAIARGNIADYQSSDGIYVDENSPNTGAIEGLEIRSRTSRDSQAGNITIKRPVVLEAMRNKIFKRDGNKCVSCSSTVNLQLDHIVSLSKGGHTEESNLQTLCEECNKAKGAGKNSQPYITTRLKLHNPMTAIAELNKMGGDYPQQPTPSVNVNVGIVTVIEKVKDYGN